MWKELIGGMILYIVGRILFYNDDTDPEFDSSRFNMLFAVAKRLEKLYSGCKVYVGLRIPDPDSATRQNIDIVLVTDQEAVVISVTNVSGFVSIDKDGNWACRDAENHTTSHFPNPVARTKQLIPIQPSLKSILTKGELLLRKDIFLLKSYVPTRISDSFPDEVFTYNHCEQLKPEKVNVNSGGMNETRFGGKKKLPESFSEKLNSVLGSAPIWDRLELELNNDILEEFIEFRGEQEDLQLLSKIKRSKVGRLMIQEMSTSDSVHSMVKILYAPRDYRVKGPSWSSKWEEIAVRSSTQIVFQPQGSTKNSSFRLSSVVSVSLST